MGLAERRAVQEYKDTYYADEQKIIVKAVGFDVPIEVDWEKITVGVDTNSYRNELYSTYFGPLSGALGRVGQDAMGKEALKAGLKKIIVTNDPATAIDVADGEYEKKGWPKFEDGVLYINIKYPAPKLPANRGEAIQKSLEAKL